MADAIASLLTSNVSIPRLFAPLVTDLKMIAAHALIMGDGALAAIEAITSAQSREIREEAHVLLGWPEFHSHLHSSLVGVGEEVRPSTQHYDVFAWSDETVEHHLQTPGSYREPLVRLGMKVFNGVGTTGSAVLKGDFDVGDPRIVGRCREGEGFPAERVAETNPC